MKTVVKSAEITFAEYMERALYGPRGYYASGVAKSGRAGDYFTAPDVGPTFGRLLASIFVQWQKRMDRSPFHLVEMGAGEGVLAEGIAKALLDDWRSESRTFPYTAIERSPARRESLQFVRKLFSDFRILPTLRPLIAAPVSGCFFANELVDALPVHRVRFRQGRLEEAYITPHPSPSPLAKGRGRGEGNLQQVWGAPSTPKLQAYLDRLGLELPEDYETEINLAMNDWIREVSQSLSRGLVVIIDYGRPARQYYAPERSEGTLRAFHKHRLGSDPVLPLGSDPTDITADVDFTSLALDAREAGLEPLAFMEMGSFLMLGAERLGPEALRSARGLRYLVHPEGLGSAFHVLVLGKGLAPEEWGFEHNRLARLGLEDTHGERRR